MAKLLVVIALLLTVHLKHGATKAGEIDVVNYSVTLEPDIADKSVKGTAAYLEQRFGRAVYLREIETYRSNYEKVRAV